MWKLDAILKNVFKCVAHILCIISFFCATLGKWGTFKPEKAR